MSQYKDMFDGGNPPQHQTMGRPPQGEETNIAIAIILCFVTCGLYGLVWQYKQMSALNDAMGRNEYSFGAWFLLSFITCGLYAIYYEYKMAQGIVEIQESMSIRTDPNLPILCLILSIFGLGIVSMAIQQGEINKMYQRQY